MEVTINIRYPYYLKHTYLSNIISETKLIELDAFLLNQLEPNTMTMRKHKPNSIMKHTRKDKGNQTYLIAKILHNRQQHYPSASTVLCKVELSSHLKPHSQTFDTYHLKSSPRESNSVRTVIFKQN